jgi:hypothetical protein
VDGCKQLVRPVAFSPAGTWLATTWADGRLRLWPLPGTGPAEVRVLGTPAVLARLKSVTNLRAVRDPKCSTGWTVELGPFPGWKDLPTW